MALIMNNLFESSSKSAEEMEIPKTVLEYLASKKVTILNDYKTPSGQHSEHCGLIANALAKLLIEAGKEPYIMLVTEDVHKNGFVYTKDLEPLIYNGNVSWGSHLVCCCENVAFDPMIGNPVNIDQYTQIVFGELIHMGIAVSKDKLKELLNK